MHQMQPHLRFLSILKDRLHYLLDILISFLVFGVLFLISLFSYFQVPGRIRKFRAVDFNHRNKLLKVLVLYFLLLFDNRLQVVGDLLLNYLFLGLPLSLSSLG